jgi:hypothetical protein
VGKQKTHRRLAGGFEKSEASFRNQNISVPPRLALAQTAKRRCIEQLLGHCCFEMVVTRRVIFAALCIRPQRAAQQILPTSVYYF